MAKPELYSKANEARDATISDNFRSIYTSSSVRFIKWLHANIPSGSQKVSYLFSVDPIKHLHPQPSLSSRVDRESEKEKGEVMLACLVSPQVEFGQRWKIRNIVDVGFQIACKVRNTQFLHIDQNLSRKTKSTKKKKER